VSDFGSGSVELLNSTYGLSGTITNGMNGPDGDWYDSNGNLFVANYAGVTLQEYAPGSSTPMFTYSSGLDDPIDVTTDTLGNVYAADYGFGGNAGFVAEYAQGSNVVSNQCFPGGAAEGVAVDATGDVFVSYNAGSYGKIVEYVGGLAGCSGTVLPVTLGYAGGLRIDQNGNLVACDQFVGVDIIPAPYSYVLSTIPGASDSFHVALNDAQNLLFIADPGQGVVIVDNYPSGSSVTTLNGNNGLSDPAGVAVATASQSDPCSGQTAKAVGECHLLIVQTLLAHFAEIKAATGLTDPPPPDQAAEVFFQAALQVPDIDPHTKSIISTIATNYQLLNGVDPGAYCDNALAQFDGGLQNAIGSSAYSKRILSFLKGELGQGSSCAGFNFGVQSATQVYRSGKTTIYNPKWYKLYGQPNGSTSVKKVVKDAVGADLAGAAGGAVTGLLVGGIGAGPGALAGGVGGTVTDLVLDLWNWITG